MRGEYAEIETIQRHARILFEPQGWGLPYRKLHDQTDVSGYEMFVLESHDNFQNPFAEAMRQIYEQGRWFGLILKDVVRNGGKGTDDKGRPNLKYVSHASTEWRKEHNIWAPKNGWYVPNEDCEKVKGVVIPFAPGTMVPFETVNTKKEAQKRFEKYGLDPVYASYFYRLDSYDDDRFAGRGFGGGGRFGALLVGLPSYSGGGWESSLPAYDDLEPTIRVKAVPK